MEWMLLPALLTLCMIDMIRAWCTEKMAPAPQPRPCPPPCKLIEPASDIETWTGQYRCNHCNCLHEANIGNLRPTVFSYECQCPSCGDWAPIGLPTWVTHQMRKRLPLKEL